MKLHRGRAGVLAMAVAGAAAVGLVPTGGGAGAANASATAVAWGRNSFGQLGSGTTSNASAPVPVINLPAVTAASAGGEFSLARGADGTVWAWGLNNTGDLGNGTTSSSLTPVQIPNFSGVTAVAAGYQHSLALRSDGTVWAWGWNPFGDLGDGTTNGESSPVQTSGLTNVVQIAAGTGHSLALEHDGTVWAWGDNSDGQLGDGTKTQRTTPVEVTGLTNIVGISAGPYFSLAVKADGTVWGWGDDYDGQLGDGNLVTTTAVPVQASGLTRAIAVAAGQDHAIALLNDGTVWSWGYNNNGQLGLGCSGDFCGNNLPAKVPGVSGVVQITAGEAHNVVLTSNGSAFAWGYNGEGQLGTGTSYGACSASGYDCSSVAVAVPALSGIGTVASGSNALHTLGVPAPAPPPTSTTTTSSTTTTTAPPTADLALTLSAAPNPVKKASRLTFTITVVDNGPSAATAATVTDQLPAGVTFVSDAASQGTCSGTTTVTCKLGPMAAQGSATLSIVVTAPGKSSTITDKASVTSLPSDPNPANNSGSVAVSVTTH